MPSILTVNSSKRACSWPSLAREPLPALISVWSVWNSPVARSRPSLSSDRNAVDPDRQLVEARLQLAEPGEGTLACTDLGLERVELPGGALQAVVKFRSECRRS